MRPFWFSLVTKFNMALGAVRRIIATHFVDLKKKRTFEIRFIHSKLEIVDFMVTILINFIVFFQRRIIIFVRKILFESSNIFVVCAPVVRTICTSCSLSWSLEFFVLFFDFTLVTESKFTLAIALKSIYAVMNWIQFIYNCDPFFLPLHALGVEGLFLCQSMNNKTQFQIVCVRF